ncbi:CBS domain-containing protein, partial [Pseudomonas aeruginosa]|nr:CBS domain-containing protein [Pseudomonas aeruginosa]
AVDIPSGLSADTGAVLGEAIRADLTVTFIGLKIGLFTGEAPARVGELVFDELGSDAVVLQGLQPRAHRLARNALPSLAARPRTAHKGLFGHLLVVGGDTGMALGMLLMFALRCLHPPSCALALSVALNPSLSELGIDVVWPILLSTLVLIGCALLYNNLMRSPYPRPYQSPRANLHGTRDLAPSARTDFSARDLDQALQDFGEYVDITRDDLERLIHHTERYALRRRMGELTAARIMSRDVQTASTETFIDDAWKQLQEHRLKALPVLDEHRRLAGIVTQSDLLKHFRPDGSPFKRLRFLRGTKLKTIMTTPVVCVQADTHAVELVSLLSDEGLHCLPVLNEAGYLVGIVSQTDLIAALYRNWLQHLGQADQIT